MMPVIEPTEATAPLRLLDVRDAESHAAGHGIGAVRVPIENWVAAARTPEGALTNPAHLGGPSPPSASGLGQSRASTTTGA